MVLHLVSVIFPTITSSADNKLFQPVELIAVLPKSYSGSQDTTQISVNIVTFRLQPHHTANITKLFYHGSLHYSCLSFIVRVKVVIPTFFGLEIVITTILP